VPTTLRIRWNVTSFRTGRVTLQPAGNSRMIEVAGASPPKGVWRQLNLMSRILSLPFLCTKVGSSRLNEAETFQLPKS
jgi:hypothetical protein